MSQTLCNCNSAQTVFKVNFFCMFIEQYINIMLSFLLVILSDIIVNFSDVISD